MTEKPVMAGADKTSEKPKPQKHAKQSEKSAVSESGKEPEKHAMTSADKISENPVMQKSAKKEENPAVPDSSDASEKSAEQKKANVSENPAVSSLTDVVEKSAISEPQEKPETLAPAESVKTLEKNADEKDISSAKTDVPVKKLPQKKRSTWKENPGFQNAGMRKQYAAGGAAENKRREIMANTCYDNRELSWLKFNTRVLEEAEDVTNPFGERLSFASIFQSNLDEFFGVRVGSLYDQMLISEDIRDNKTNMTCREQLFAIFDQVKLLTQRKDANYAELKKGMMEHGIEIMNFTEMEKKDVQYLDAYFEHQIRPLLSPQIVGKKQPFPFLKNKDIYAVVVLGKKKNSPKLGIVPCMVDGFPRLVRIPDHANRYVLVEELILHYVAQIFEHYDIRSKSLIRVLRNADIDPDEEMYDDDTDFRKVMEQLVSRRRRLCPIKLEYTRLMDQSVLDLLCKHLQLKKRHVFHSDSPLDLSFFSKVRDLLRNEKDLFYPKYSPQAPADIDKKRSMMDQIREKDRFLFFPYESIDPFLRLLNEAADDPDVLSIKMTLYRVASDSKVVEALLRAAENGKEVDVLVELRARFDEENNIGWSRRLEDAGCRLLYGLDGLKVHSKLCLITRRQEGEIFYYTQIGTGNYNEKTSRLYTDFSLMTAHQGIGAEANEVFTKLYLGEVMKETKYLMVAPKCLRSKILERIDLQIARAKAGETAYVGAKMNSLTDKTIIEKLIEASCAGVKIDLVVRGACCLIAGVAGVTENITVRSIVGRYLEHSRIYIFGAENPEVYIASADFMTRNTTRRVEVAAPVYDEDIKARVLKIFNTQLADNVRARIQLADGQYVHIKTEGEPVLSQERFQHAEYR